MINKHLVWTLAVLTLLSCQSEISDRGDFVPPYFLLEEFVQKQASELEGKTLHKEIQIDETKETVNLSPDKDNWLQELDFFIQADINRPSLASAFDVFEDANTLSYTLKKGEKSKLKFLKIELNQNGDPYRISFKMSGSNTFYESNTNGWLTVDVNTGLISRFEITGKQKVSFLSPIEMQVRASIE
ncbi:hypothetical protein SAMN06295967_109144 [Belliella buryatensis]|uniref:Lipoprotein n=1 Tax=Belliella buryatensis TaxID=1500549 RepID=A0A239EGT0_9BACT|nr:hypothetical protein [Belliella buryatensis]SNS43856.1 hypothetical protein SAMN06295967_109144 [Belliella buryatensis]